MKYADPSLLETASVNHQVLHPGSRTLFSYWEALRAERLCPRRDEFRLADIKDLVPYLFIWERSKTRNSFTYRLSGSAVDRLHCRSMTDRDVLEGWDHFESDVMMRTFRAAQERFQPGLVRMRLFTVRKEVIGTELLVLPFQAQGSGNIQLVGGMFPFADIEHMIIGGIESRQLMTSRTIWTEHLEAGHDAADTPTIPRRTTPLRVIQGGRID